MAFQKTALILFFVAFAMMALIGTTQAADWVQPCDQVCSRIVPERTSCCQAHQYSSYAFCSGGHMYCS